MLMLTVLFFGSFVLLKVGILAYAQHHLSVELKESWYEQLQRWQEALVQYEKKAAAAAADLAAAGAADMGFLGAAASSASAAALTLLDTTLGRMRCLGALAR